MDWASIICAGIGGGIGGAMGALICKKLPESKKNLRTIIITSFFVVLAKVVPSTPLKATIDNALFPKSRLDRAAQDFGLSLEKDQAIIAKFKSLPAEERSVAAKKYGREGLYWLGAEELDKWSSFRLLLFASSQKLCSGLLTGQITHADLEQGFEGLTDEQTKAWFSLSYASMKAAIENENNFDPKKAETEIQGGLSQIFSLIGEADSKRLLDVLQNSGTKSEEDRCWASKTLHESAKKLPVSERHQFLRALASSG